MSFRNNILFVLLLLSAGLRAQTVEVQDPVFAQWLCSRVPLVMDAECKLLDTVKAVTEYPDPFEIDLSHKEIKIADEILYFENADSIRLNFNELTSFPQDISRIRNIGRLQLANNKLTAAPDIRYTNKYGADTAVKLLYLNDNDLATLPDSWNDPNPFTQVISIEGNYLVDIPDFVNYPQIRRLDVRENYLGFDDLIPIKNHPNWGTWQFDLFPQRLFEVDIDTVVAPGSSITIDVSTGLASNEYDLLKDDTRIDRNREGVFEIQFNSEEELSEYWVKIRNDNFPDPSEFLASERLRFSFEVVPTNIQEGNVFVFSPDGDGVADSFMIEGEGQTDIIDKNGQVLRTVNLPFEWNGDDQNGVKQSPGLYVIKKADGDFIKVLIAY